ncbi:MAG: hypothetical protein WEB58_09860 [Planctomycetaceae bacterium]
MNLPASQVSEMRSAIELLLEHTSAFIESCPDDPIKGSILDQDLTSASRPESIITALSFGDLALEFAADHLSALSRLLSEPVDTMACFTCIRSMLEMTAVGAWVLDPALTSHDRIARVFAIRFEAIDQQLKYGRCISVDPQEIQSLEARLLNIENEAISLGHKKLRNKKGSMIGIGVLMPSATDMIRDMLNLEWLYRLLSGVAHGHHWAIVPLGFQDAKSAGPMSVGGISVTPYEKKVYVNGLALVGRAIAR